MRRRLISDDIPFIIRLLITLFVVIPIMLLNYEEKYFATSVIMTSLFALAYNIRKVVSSYDFTRTIFSCITTCFIYFIILPELNVIYWITAIISGFALNAVTPTFSAENEENLKTKIRFRECFNLSKITKDAAILLINFVLGYIIAGLFFSGFKDIINHILEASIWILFVIIGYGISRLVEFLIFQPSLKSFAAVNPYLRTMILPTMGFSLVHFCIMTWFSAIFMLLLHFDANSFSRDIQAKHFGNLGFFYFSMQQILPASIQIGIKPVTHLALFFSSLETFIGFLWALVAFAAIIAYLAPIFKEIDNISNQKD